MVSQTLSKEKKEEDAEILEYYKKVYVCKKCGKKFGSDFEIESGICSFCEGKASKKRWGK